MGFFIEVFMLEKFHVSRKIVLFIVSLAAVLLLAYKGKDFSGVVALYGLYVTGNVTQKFKKE